MSIDPMTTYEQAEVEAAERQDEARRERHFAEAEAAARDYFMARRVLNPSVSYTQLIAQLFTDTGAGPVPGLRDQVLTLGSFHSDYGVSALLRVIASALEAPRG